MLTPAPAPTSPELSRTGIMLRVLPVVMTELKGIAGLDLGNIHVLRRAFRAILTVGLRLMLDAGVSPEIIVNECKTAIGNELKERADKAKEQGATQKPASA